MKTRVAVAWQAGLPLTIEEVDLAAPKAGEVLLKSKQRAFVIPTITRYLALTLKAYFLLSWGRGRRGRGRYRPGVKSLQPGDRVIPLYTPECRECKFCLSEKLIYAVDP